MDKLKSHASIRTAGEIFSHDRYKNTSWSAMHSEINRHMATACAYHHATTVGFKWMLNQPSSDLFHEAFEAWLAHKGAKVPFYESVEIVFSGPDVAGEGEHKIMAHIRAQRTQPGYDADTTHCVYGLDADLVMLALATHEPRFFLLRDFVPSGRLKFLQRCDAGGAVGSNNSQIGRRSLLHPALQCKEWQE